MRREEGRSILDRSGRLFMTVAEAPPPTHDATVHWRLSHGRHWDKGISVPPSRRVPASRAVTARTPSP